MVPGRVLPPAEGLPAGKKKTTQLMAAAAIIIIAALAVVLLLLLASVSSFSFPWTDGKDNQNAVVSPSKIPVIEADYTGIWQGYTPDNKRQVIMFTSDNRFRHWVADNVSTQAYNGSWRYDSSLYVYRLVYDREDYSSSVKISSEAQGDQIMHFEPLSSAAGMPLKGFDLERVAMPPATPDT